MVQDIRTLGLPALLSFHTVARLGGISAAAERLGIAKSGVSRHVSQLEAHFGIRLLERSARSVKLTPIGERLDQRIRSILAEVDLLGDIVREESTGVSGHVSIAGTPEFGGMVASHLFPAMHARYPDLTLSMRPDYAFEDMQDPGTDLAFRVGSFDDDRLVVRRLGAFRCWVVAAPALAQQSKIARPEDLADLPCLTFRGDRGNGRWTLFSGNSETAVDIAGPFGVRSFFVLLELAAAGQGFAFLPDFMLPKAIESSALVRCLPDHVSRPFSVFLTFRPGARSIARVDATISMAEEIVPPLLSDR